MYKKKLARFGAMALAAILSLQNLTIPVQAETLSGADESPVSYDCEPLTVPETPEDIAQCSEEAIAGSTVASTTEYAVSGRSSVDKLSMKKLSDLYRSIGTYSSIYSTNPDLSKDGYKISTLSPEAMTAVTDHINYYRTVAGLGSITMTDELNESAAYGALVLAMGSQFTHYPAQPEGMSDEDYQKGYAATTSSNLSYSSGYGVSRVLPVAVSGQMADESGSNLSCLGHRRWLLNPNVKTMGVGTANSGSKYYTDIRVFGTGVTTETVSDYDFIAWPASGNNLSDTFDISTPWSITLNPGKYQTPDVSNVSITLKSIATDTTWTFNQSTGTTESSTASYFTVNTGGYGVSNCIIFRPSYSKITAYSGDYIVEVTGLKTKAGTDTSLTYKVTFDTDANASEMTDDPGTGDTPGKGDTPGSGDDPGTEDDPGKGDTPGSGDDPGTTDDPGKGDTPGTSDTPGSGEESDDNTSSQIYHIAAKGKIDAGALIRLKLHDSDIKIGKYKVDDTKVASVSSKGIVTGKKDGTVTVTAYSKSGRQWIEVGSIKVQVNKPVFKFTKDLTYVGAKLDAGDFITNLPEGVPVAWSVPVSKKPTVSIDSKTGTITSLKTGSMKVTCTIGQGTYAAKYTATVKVKVPKLRAVQSIRLAKSKTITLSNISAYTDVTWSVASSDAAILKIEPTKKAYSVKVTALKPSATPVVLTATVDGQKYQTSITIK